MLRLQQLWQDFERARLRAAAPARDEPEPVYMEAAADGAAAAQKAVAAAKKAANGIKQLEKEARDRIAASRRNGGFASLPSRLQLEQSEGVRPRMRERKHVLDVARQDRGWHEAHARTPRAHIARIMVYYKVLYKSVKRTTASPCLQSHDW